MLKLENQDFAILYESMGGWTAPVKYTCWKKIKLEAEQAFKSNQQFTEDPGDRETFRMKLWACINRNSNYGNYKTNNLVSSTKNWSKKRGDETYRLKKT